jgi:chemotaxis protein methyltransferase WspC
VSLKEIEDLLEHKIGLSADTIGSEIIAAAVQSRMARCGFIDAEAYLKRIRESELEWEELIEALVVPETWFFRNQESFEFLSQYVLSDWMPANKKGLLRVLSVPCATGEEPYSIAMTLVETCLPSNRFLITGVDISRKSIEKALQGLYGVESFRSCHMLELQQRYFTKKASKFHIHESIRNSVQFIHGNLTEEQILSDTLPYDVIFCRNLLIYLTRRAQKKVISLIDRLLTKTGLIFVGHVERFLFRNMGYSSVVRPGVFALYRISYKKACHICRR